MDDAAQKLKDQTSVVEPVGVVRKESEPIVNHEPFIMPSEAEPRLHPEVSEAEIKVVKENLELNNEHRAFGMEPAGDSIPVPTEPTTKIKIPLSEEQADEIIKNQKHDSAIAEHTEGIYRTSSAYGLAVLVKKIIKEIHERLIGQKV